MRSNALLAFVICGIVGVLVDIDHLVAYYFVPEWGRRFLHTPLLIVSCIVLCGLIAYLTRLLVRMVLNKERR